MSRFKKLFKKNKEEKFGTYIDTSTIESVPPENELFRMFEKLMTELGITNIKKETMRKMTNKRKWLLLCQHKSKEELRRLREESGQKTPQSFYNKLRDQQDYQIISELKVALSSNPLSWLNEFLMIEGLQLICNTLTGLTNNKDMNNQKPNQIMLELELIKCCKALMNNKIGLNSFLSHFDHVKPLVFCLETENWQYLTTLIELLAVINIAPPNGHKFILKSLDMLQEKTNLISRFSILIQHLVRSINDRSSIDFKISCIMFINTIVNTSQDINYRIQLRKEFAILGIRRILNKFESDKFPDLQTQINLFLNEWKSDENESGEIIQDIPQRDENDPVDIFKYLSKNMIKSKYKLQFNRILNKLCDASYDNTIGLWGTLDVVINRIINDNVNNNNSSSSSSSSSGSNKLNKKIIDLENYILKQSKELIELDSSLDSIIKAATIKMKEFLTLIENSKYDILQLKIEKLNKQNDNKKKKEEPKNELTNNEEIKLLENEIENLKQECIELKKDQEEDLKVNKIKNDENTKEYILELNEKIDIANKEIERLLDILKSLEKDTVTYQETIVALTNEYRLLNEEYEDLEDLMAEMIESGKYSEPEINSEEIEKKKIEKIENFIKEFENLISNIDNVFQNYETFQEKISLEKKKQNEIINKIKKIEKNINYNSVFYELQEENENLNEEKENEKQNKNENEKEKENEIEKEKEKEMEIEKEKEKLSPNQEKMKNLIQQIEKLSHDYQAYQRVISTTKKKYEKDFLNLKTKVETKESGVNLLDQQFQNKITKIEKKKQLKIKQIEENFENDREELLNEIKNLTNQISNLKTDIKGYELNIDLLHQSYQEEILEMVSQDQNQAMGNNEILLQKLETETKYKKKSIDDYEEKIKNQQLISNQKIESLRMDMNKKEKELNEIEKQIQLLIKNSQIYIEDSDQYQFAISQIKLGYEEDIEDLKTEIEFKKRKINNFSSKNNNNNNNINNSDDDDNKEIDEKELIMKNENNELNIIDNQLKINKLKEDNLAYKRTINIFEKKIEQMNKKLNYLKNSNDELIKIIDNVKKIENNLELELRKQISSYKSQISNLSISKTLSRREITSNTNKNNEGINENNQANNLIEKLQNQIKKLSNSLANERSMNTISLHTIKNRYQTIYNKVGNNIKSVEQQIEEIKNDILNERKQFQIHLSDLNRTNQNLKQKENNKLLLEKSYQIRIVNMQKQLQNYFELNKSNQNEIEQLKQSQQQRTISTISKNIRNSKKATNKKISSPGRSVPNRGFLAQKRDFEKTIENLKKENTELKKQLTKENQTTKKNLEQEFVHELFNSEMKLLPRFLKNTIDNNNKDNDDDDDDDDDDGDDNNDGDEIKNENGNLINKDNVNVNVQLSKSKMKIFNWDKLNKNRTKKTIWSGIAGNEKKIQINFEELENDFKINNYQNNDNQQNNDKNESLIHSSYYNSNEEDQILIKIINQERTKNIAIMLSKIKYSNFTIKNAIVKFDDQILTIENLKELLKNSPTENELNSLREFSGIIPTRIAKAEQFFLEIMDIPRFSNRIDSWLCVRTFNENYEMISKMTEDVMLACNELKDSKLFFQILKNCLQIGNYLNGGTFRGAAYGFKLNSLLKLINIKSDQASLKNENQNQNQNENENENKSKNLIKNENLLNYLVNLFKRQNPENCNLLKELSHIRDASRCSIKLLQDKLHQINSRLNIIHSELQDYTLDDEYGKIFKEKFGNFLIKAIKDQKIITEKFSKMKNVFQKTCFYFGEKYQSDPSIFFSSIAEFLIKFQRIFNTSNVNQSSSKFIQSQQGRGIVDGLIQTLKSGTSFKQDQNF
ncbi:protein diaphanous [Anaeramoeba flamelloides]|uniref:Protein diaphanous n=1 Tax=Anaeramoeba flamelloides TaxID=1746091 RepID=A0AAV7Z3F6_9EUKA|nr:protein diaphanous [Anaeramoeba flamelloides]